MKKTHFTTFCLFAAVMLLCGCERVIYENELSDNDPSGNVRLRISDFEAMDGDVRSVQSVTAVCTRLHFVVYKNGTQVKAVTQKSDDSLFGEVTMSLAPDTYQLLILAHSGLANPSLSNPARIAFTNASATNGTGFTDTFYYYGDLTVSEEDNIQESFMLKRAVAMFRLTTTDVKPAEVKKFHIIYKGGSGTFDATTGFGCVNSTQVDFIDTDSSLDGQPIQISLYSFLHAETGEMQFTIRALDSKDAELYAKDFNNVPMKRNTITEYCGAFFGGTPIGGKFTFQVETDWEETNVYNF